MKAIMKKSAAPGLVMGEIDKPVLQKGEVIIKVAATGICGSDIHIYDWTSGYEWLEPYFPAVLGHEFSGIVVETGEGVADSWIGKKVVCMPGKTCLVCPACSRGQHNLCSSRRTIGLHSPGSFTDYVAVPVINCMVLPENVDLEIAALSEPLAVAANAVELAGIEVGETVVVLGPGTIGLMLAFLAKKAGAARVILTGVAADEARLTIGKKIGADMIVRVDENDLTPIVMEATGGSGADHVFEASGNGRALIQGIGVLKSGGDIVLVGIHGAPVSLDINALVRKEKRLLGAYGSSPKTWQRVIRILAESGNQLRPLITHRFPLEEGLAGFKASKEPGAVKVIIKSSEG